MEFAFDDAKDVANIAKHGVLLILGAIVLQNSIGERLDGRRDYGETRINASGMVRNRLFACTYTIRGLAYRIISVRIASRKEQREWLPSK